MYNKYLGCMNIKNEANEKKNHVKYNVKPRNVHLICIPYKNIYNT